MHFTGLVFGPNPQELMDALIQTPDSPTVRVPLLAADERARSGWHSITSQYTQDPHGHGYYSSGSRCVWPTAFLRKHLGPCALLSDTSLTTAELASHDISKKDGEWWAQVPRFFSNIGVFWMFAYRSPRWSHGEYYTEPDDATVSGIDLPYVLAEHDPNLIVGPDGPVFFEGPQKISADSAPRRLATLEPLMKLPPSTSVNLVFWHDTKPVPPNEWGFDEGAGCSCAPRRTRYHWATPYPGWERDRWDLQ